MIFDEAGKLVVSDGANKALWETDTCGSAKLLLVREEDSMSDSYEALVCDSHSTAWRPYEYWKTNGSGGSVFVGVKDEMGDERR